MIFAIRGLTHPGYVMSPLRGFDQTRNTSVGCAHG
jgi:hypothetical protein